MKPDKWSSSQMSLGGSLKSVYYISKGGFKTDAWNGPAPCYRFLNFYASVWLFLLKPPYSTPLTCHDLSKDFCSKSDIKRSLLLRIFSWKVQFWRRLKTRFYTIFPTVLAPIKHKTHAKPKFNMMNCWEIVALCGFTTLLIICTGVLNLTEIINSDDCCHYRGWCL
jgi:hypothetical protein